MHLSAFVEHLGKNTCLKSLGGWKPLLRTTHQVSSYKGFADVLDNIASLSNHTHQIVPILVDENIDKRCLKLLYWDRTQDWNWHEKLKRTPNLYGCWHPYKCLVTDMWWRFHSLFVFFRFGRLGVGKTVGSYPKLRVMERIIAGILKCAPHFLRQLRHKANGLQAISDHGGLVMDRLKSVVLSARKVHPLLEEAAAENGSRKNYSFWTFAAYMNQTTQKK